VIDRLDLLITSIVKELFPYIQGREGGREGSKQASKEPPSMKKSRSYIYILGHMPKPC
jgi:hypothetical protein